MKVIFLDGLSEMLFPTTKDAIVRTVNLLVRALTMAFAWLVLGGIGVTLHTAIGWLVSRFEMPDMVANIVSQVPTVYISVFILATALSGIKDIISLFLMDIDSTQQPEKGQDNE